MAYEDIVTYKTVNIVYECKLGLFFSPQLFWEKVTHYMWKVPTVYGILNSALLVAHSIKSCFGFKTWAECIKLLTLIYNYNYFIAASIFVKSCLSLSNSYITFSLSYFKVFILCLRLLKGLLLGVFRFIFLFFEKKLFDFFCFFKTIFNN